MTWKGLAEAAKTVLVGLMGVAALGLIGGWIASQFVVLPQGEFVATDAYWKDYRKFQWIQGGAMVGLYFVCCVIHHEWRRRRLRVAAANQNRMPIG